MPRLHEFRNEEDAVEFIIANGFGVGTPPEDPVFVNRKVIFYPRNYVISDVYEKLLRTVTFLANEHLYRAHGSFFLDDIAAGYSHHLTLKVLGLKTLRTKNGTYQ